MNSTAETSYVARPEIKGKGVVVLVHRHTAPDRWGVHEMHQRAPEPHEMINRFDHVSLALTKKRAPRWTSTTVGLFSRKPELALQGFSQLSKLSIAAHAAEKPPGLVLLANNEFDSILHFIGDQILPLEWKQQWVDGDREITGRVEVWV